MDGENWTTLYRETAGLGEDLIFNCYQDARYVRMQGVAMRDNGYSIKIFNVYKYVEGETKTNPELAEFTDRVAFLFKLGTYSTNVDVGFYTEVLGLGMKSTDTNISLFRCGI